MEHSTEEEPVNEKAMDNDDLDRREAAEVERTPVTAEDVANMRVFHNGREPQDVRSPVKFNPVVVNHNQRITPTHEEDPVLLMLNNPKRNVSPSGANMFQHARRHRHTDASNKHHNVVRLMKMHRKDDPLRIEFVQDEFAGPVSLAGFAVPTRGDDDHTPQPTWDSDEKQRFDVALQNTLESIRVLLTYPREYFEHELFFNINGTDEKDE
jgi:hypothetical protein